MDKNKHYSGHGFISAALKNEKTAFFQVVDNIRDSKAYGTCQVISL